MKNSINKLMVFGLLVGFAVTMQADQERSMRYSAVIGLSQQYHDAAQLKSMQVFKDCLAKSGDCVQRQSRCVELRKFLEQTDKICMMQVYRKYWEQQDMPNVVVDVQEGLDNCRRNTEAMKALFCAAFEIKQ